jgi:hypothetical protein
MMGYIKNSRLRSLAQEKINLTFSKLKFLIWKQILVFLIIQFVQQQVPLIAQNHQFVIILSVWLRQQKNLIKKDMFLQLQK